MVLREHEHRKVLPNRSSSVSRRSSVCRGHKCVWRTCIPDSQCVLLGQSSRCSGKPWGRWDKLANYLLEFRSDLYRQIHCYYQQLRRQMRHVHGFLRVFFPVLAVVSLSWLNMHPPTDWKLQLVNNQREAPENLDPITKAFFY